MHEISLQEYRDWHQFYLDYPFGPHVVNYNSANIAKTLVDLLGSRKRRFKLADFLPNVRPYKPKPINQQISSLKAWAASFKKET